MVFQAKTFPIELPPSRFQHTLMSGRNTPGFNADSVMDLDVEPALSSSHCLGGLTYNDENKPFVGIHILLEKLFLLEQAVKCNLLVMNFTLLHTNKPIVDVMYGDPPK